MAKQSKRAQLESMGWKFTAIPRFIHAGLINNPSTRYKSPAYYCYEDPDGWQITPPTGVPCEPRRFDGRSPNSAVRWAYEQAMAPGLKAELTGGLHAGELIFAKPRTIVPLNTVK